MFASGPSVGPRLFNTLGFYDSHVCRDAVPELDLDDVPEGQLLCQQRDFFPVPYAERILGDHVFEGVHDAGGLVFLRAK